MLLLLHYSADFFAFHGSYDILWILQAKDQNGYVIVHAHRGCGAVHNMQPIGEYLHKGERIVFHSILETVGSLS